MSRIALIVLDTLRKDAFDKHFDWLPGTRFENAWSTSHWTVPAHASLFTGEYGSESGIHAKSKQLDYSGLVLAEELKEEGYKTRSFSANPNISPIFNYNRGFSEFRGSWRVQAMRDDLFDWNTFILNHKESGITRFPKAIGACLKSNKSTIPSLKYGAQLKLRDLGYGPTKGDGVKEAISYVSKISPNSDDFLFINLTEAHTPYNPPEPYKTDEVFLDGLSATLENPDSSPLKIRSAYDAAVQYLSDMYQKLFEELESKYDLIVTVSDHGEMLGENGVWGHLYGLYPELTHVPLVLSGDDNVSKTEVFDLVNLIDVHETVRQEAGLEEGKNGKNLCAIDTLKKRELLTEYHGLSQSHYDRLMENGNSDIGFFQDPLRGLIKDSYYGFETHNEGFIESEEWTDSETAKDRLSTLHENLPELETDSEEIVISSQAQKSLRDLGYI